MTVQWNLGYQKLKLKCFSFCSEIEAFYGVNSERLEKKFKHFVPLFKCIFVLLYACTCGHMVVVMLMVLVSGGRGQQSKNEEVNIWTFGVKMLKDGLDGGLFDTF